MNDIVVEPELNQIQSPLAIVQGQSVTQMPIDLYIPPDALRVFLETFEGPLDLLLYLIKRQNLDILNIPIFAITTQYMEYVELMHELHFELAAEYLVMAAMLAEIKSRMLLPRPPKENEIEEDPRAELVRRLQEYERFKKAAEDLDAIPREGRDFFAAHAQPPDLESVRPLPEVVLREVLLALKDIMARVKLVTKHQIQQETMSMRERMTIILAKINNSTFTTFTSLFEIKEGRLGVVVTFLAILELLKDRIIEIAQAEPFHPLYIKAVACN